MLQSTHTAVQQIQCFNLKWITSLSEVTHTTQVSRYRSCLHVSSSNPRLMFHSWSAFCQVPHCQEWHLSFPGDDHIWSFVPKLARCYPMYVLICMYSVIHSVFLPLGHGLWFRFVKKVQEYRDILRKSSVLQKFFNSVWYWFLVKFWHKGLVFLEV